MSDTTNNPKTIEEALQQAAKVGIEVPTEIIIKAQQAAELRRDQLERDLERALQSTSKGQIAVFVERFNRLYPKILQTLIGIGDVMISLTQTILIGIGVPVVLLLLMVVEQQRVYRGMALFEVESTLAAFGATVLVICNLVFELLISWREHQAHWQEPTHYQFSFRLLAQRIAYMVGLTTNWQPAAKSPALRFKVVLRIITFSILMLALAGSMESVINKVGGNWYDAIVSIFTRSTLLEFTTWAGGLLFAIAAVFSAQALSQYVANKTIEIIAIMQSNIDDKPKAIAEAMGITGAMYILTYIKDAQRQRRQSAALAFDPDDNEQIIRLKPVSSVSVVSETTETSTTPKYSPEMIQAIAWLEKHPSMDGLSLREASREAGVSYSTLRRAKMQVQQ